jgi:hypothetical protein
MNIVELKKKRSGRPKEGYRNKLGDRVPGVTTITGRFKDSGALIYWAWNCGREGKDINEEKDRAADAGTCAHEMIDCHLHNKPFPEEEWDLAIRSKAEHAFMAYLDWCSQVNLSVEAAEISLVSERFQYGGTFDAVMRGGYLRLLDYKTSSGLYPEMLVQVGGGYSLLWEEHFPEKTLEGIDLLRISKPKAPDDPISFEHRHWSAELFPIAQEQFMILRRAYELDKRLKGFL